MRALPLLPPRKKLGPLFLLIWELGWVVVLVGGRAAEETYVGAVVNYLAKNRLNPNRNFYPPFDHELPLRKKAKKKMKRWVCVVGPCTEGGRGGV